MQIMTLDAIYTEALALPDDERAILAKRLLSSVVPAATRPRTPDMPPKGVPILGRGQGMLVEYIDDDEHLKDFAEYMT